MNFEIEATENGKRIDSYLAEELDLSRSKVQKLIKQELVTVNGKVVSNNYNVKLGDTIIAVSYTHLRAHET